MYQFAKIMIAAAFSLITAFSLSASAQASGEVFRAKLTYFNLDPRIQVMGQVNQGHIEIDMVQEVATLALYPEFRCPPNAYCAQVMPAPVIVTLPIIEVGTDECGSKVVTAVRDMRPADGGLEKLVIRDNTQAHCPTLIALAPTDVVYEIETAGFRLPVEKTFSTFAGDELGRLEPTSWMDREHRDITHWSELRRGNF